MSNAPKFANRRSPSGPKTSLELPFYQATAVTATTRFVTSDPTVTATETVGQHRIPVPGALDALLVQNSPVGTDVGVATYRARKNGVDVGPALLVAHNSGAAVKIDLSGIVVAENDLVSVSVTSPALTGTAGTGKVLFTWTPASNA